MNISAKVETFTAEEAAAVVNGTPAPVEDSGAGQALVNISGND
jgi:hypothetical protein